MIALDANILVYSVREESPWHSRAIHCVRQLAEGTPPWAIPWPCLHEFLAIVTHPKIYRPPLPLSDALRQAAWWRESPSLRMIGERDNYWEHLVAHAREGKIAGPLIHDARVAAICTAAGVTELWTADRDFSRFPNLRTRNPLPGNLDVDSQE